MNKEKSCLNCEHFQQYYVKYMTGIMLVEGKGRCSQPYMRNTDIQKRISENNICKHWQPAEEHEQEQNEKIKSILKRIYKQLEKILPLIQDEN